MCFQWPHLFWFLLLPAGLALAELFRRVRAAGTRHPKILRGEASPTGVTFNPAGMGSGTEPRRRVRWRLWLGLMLVITALARPQWGRVEEPVFEQAREILIAVDLSKSMLAPDVSPSRLERAKLLITSLLERLEGERVGLIVFSGTAFLQSPLSADYEILREFLPALSPDFLPEGGTNYTALLDTALDAFGDESDADRFLIILSDGESQTDDWEQRVPALRERGIQILGLGIGTVEGDMLPDGAGGFVKDERGAVVLSRLNQTTLEELARRTTGTYRDASTWVDLADLLAQTVEAGQAGEFTETRRARLIERFQWALAPAVLLLLWSFWREVPVQPRSRVVTVPAKSRTRSGLPHSATGAATLLMLASLFVGSPRGSHAATPDDDPLGAPLSLLIGKLAAAPMVDADDFAQLAEETISYGHRVLGSGQKPTLGVLYDGLDAVDAGELLDPAAADWPALRAALEELINQAEEPPPDQQPQQNDEQQDDHEQENQDQQEQDGEQSGDQQNESGEGESDQNENQGESSDQQQDGDNQGDPQDSQDGEQSEQDNPNPGREPSEQERQNAESAFGDMDEEEPSPEQEQPQPAPQPQRPPQTQRVGGQATQNADAADNPELAVPLQKLDQLKKQDSPAQLFQLMQDPNAQPPPTGRDW